MSKLTKDKEGSNVVEVKFDLKNFGADRIFVIHDPKRTQRKLDFESAWSHFDGFTYEYVDAITPDQFSINELIDQNRLASHWLDIGDMCLTHSIICIALSHSKAFEVAINCARTTYDEKLKRFLILEDDARPTAALMKSIYTGEYKKYIDGLKRRHFDIMYLGKVDHIIKGTDFNDFLKIPEPYTGLAAHAIMYDLDAMNAIYWENYQIEMAADLLIDHVQARGRFPQVYSPYNSWIQQVGHQLNDFIMQNPEHVDFEYSTGSQVNPYLDDTLEGEYQYVSRKIRNHIGDIEKEKIGGKDFVKVKWKKWSQLL